MRVQQEVIAFLSRPSSYGAGVAAVEIIETHGSLVFLVGERAYKLKRAVAYADLDFLTLARREQACRAEVALNRRTAPTLYLGVEAVCRRADGAPGFGDEGEVLDWLVVMRRFPQAALFERLARAGRLDLPLARQLGARIAAFHANAEPTPAFGARGDLVRVIDDNHREMRRYSDLLPTAALEQLRVRALQHLERLAPWLEARRTAGWVRRGHGDLRLANICLLEGQPTPFDGIEFSERIACIDVLFDLAFVLMDLDHHGLPAQGEAVLAGYRAHLAEAADARPLPLFLSLRAATRCFTLAGSAERQHDPTLAARKADEARALLTQALAYLQNARGQPH